MRTLLPLLFLVSCASPVTSSEDAASVDLEGTEVSKTTEPASLFSDPEEKHAAVFDRWVQGKLSDDEKKALLSECRSEDDKLRSPFCPVYRRAKELDKRSAALRAIPRAPEPKTVVPSVFKIKGTKVLGWQKLKKDSIPELLKGLLGLTYEQLKTVTDFALKDKRCPNPIGAAAAATLEDYLPQSALEERIARLYEAAGRCAKKNSADREHFLTRASLFYLLQKNTKKAESLLAKITPRDAFSGRSLYWLYRTRKSLGRPKEAEKAKTRLKERYRFSFHAALLSDGDPELSPSAEAKKTRSSRAQSANRFIELTEILSRHHFEISADFLARWTVEKNPKLENEVRLYLAELGDAELSVALAAEVLLRRPSLLNKKVAELAYPKPFANSFESQSSVDPYLLWALARKESVFNAKAVSHANAQGLMQVQPDTAERLERGASERLLDPNVNIALGGKYLRQLLNQFENKIPLVLAAYNAGEEPVSRWLKRYPTQDPILFIDLIPYRETRDYVSFVLSNYHWYHLTYATAKAPLKELTQSNLALSR